MKLYFITDLRMYEFENEPIMTEQLLPKRALFPQQDHDHDCCIQDLMTFAEQLCEREGLRLTRLRQDVLKEVASSHKAIGAYQILDNFALHGKKLAPISVYRSLDFLQGAGLIHRLESINAYFACQRNFTETDKCCQAQTVVFLVCDECGTIGELDGAELEPVIASYVSQNNFVGIESQLEIKGLCPLCQTPETLAPETLEPSEQGGDTNVD